MTEEDRIRSLFRTLGHVEALDNQPAVELVKLALEHSGVPV